MKNILLLLSLLPIAAMAQKDYPALLDNYAQAEFKVKPRRITILSCSLR